MARAKHSSKRRRRSKAVPVLGAAGLLSLAGGAYAATEPAADLPLQGIASGHEVILGEEEISDVSLGTFYVFDKENASTPQLGEKLAYRGCRGCGARGCGARGCARACARGCGVGRACARGCGVGGCGCFGAGCGCGCWLAWPLPCI